MTWFFRLYARRTVNVNVNVLTAGVLALIPTTIIMHLAQTRWGLSDKRYISGLTFLVDVLFDVLLYFLLHWVANHTGWMKSLRKPGLHADLSYFRGASLVQFERAALSPVLYTVWLGTQHTLMHAGLGAGRATLIGFVLGIATSRTLHTLWMLRCDRNHRAAAKLAGTKPADRAA